MSRKFYDWIQKSISYDHERKNGALIVADYDFKETTTLEFQQGLLTEIGFPALDAASKDPDTFSPTLSRYHQFLWSRQSTLLPKPSNSHWTTAHESIFIPELRSPTM
jgi:hypothetical protein